MGAIKAGGAGAIKAGGAIKAAGQKLRKGASKLPRKVVRFSSKEEQFHMEENDESSGEEDCCEEEEEEETAPLPPRRASDGSMDGGTPPGDFVSLRCPSHHLSTGSTCGPPPAATGAARPPTPPSPSSPRSGRPRRGSTEKELSESYESDGSSWRSPIGNCDGVDMRFLLLDNSGSTRKLDGWALVSEGDHEMHAVDTDRWGETASVAVAHAEWNVKSGVRSQFVLLNPPSPKRPLEGRDFVTVDPKAPHHADQVAQVAAFLRKNGPCGNTPLTTRLRQLRLRVQSGEAQATTPRSLSSSPLSPRKMSVGSTGRNSATLGKRLQKPGAPGLKAGCSGWDSQRSSQSRKSTTWTHLALTIVTDGLPTASDSTSSAAADKDAFVQELREWSTDFQCQPVIRLTTEHAGTLSYYKHIAQTVDFKVVVIGNLRTEARRARYNAWLAYSPQLQLLREGGANEGVLARLAEGRLQTSEIRELLEWLLRADAPLPKDPESLYMATEQLLPSVGLVYSGSLQHMTPPVDLRLLKRALGLSSATRRLKDLTAALALCKTGF